MRDGPSSLGFTVAVGTSGLAIDDQVGCDAQVLAGEAWITAEGAAEDVVAGVGATVPLERGLVFNVSAFRNIAAVLLIVPREQRDFGFRLRSRDGMRVLSVTPG